MTKYRFTNLYFTALTRMDSAMLFTASVWFAFSGLFLTRKKRENIFNSHHRLTFEKLFSRYTGAESVIAVPSARSGIYAALKALKIGAGDEVLVTGFTCSAVSEPIQFLKAKPVYVDISLESYTMLPELAEKSITPRTKVIIVQHTYGISAAIEQFVKIAQEHNLFVIEDCALALGSKVNDQWLGTFGDVGIFSFELSKTLSVGWGGVVQINNNQVLARRVRDIRDKGGVLDRVIGLRRLYQAGLSGFFYRPEFFLLSGKFVALLFKFKLFRPSETKSDDGNVPSDYLAAPVDFQWKVLLRQLNRIDEVLNDQSKNIVSFQKILKHHKCEKEIFNHLDGKIYMRFPLLVKDRERFIKDFYTKGIEVGKWFSQPVSCGGGDMSKYEYITGSCKNSEFAARHIVNLPLHSRMSNNDVALVMSCLDEYLMDYPDEVKFIKEN
jgi:perosamine synthetase